MRSTCQLGIVKNGETFEKPKISLDRLSTFLIKYYAGDMVSVYFHLFYIQSGVGMWPIFVSIRILCGWGRHMGDGHQTLQNNGRVPLKPVVLHGV